MVDCLGCLGGNEYVRVYGREGGLPLSGEVS